MTAQPWTPTTVDAATEAVAPQAAGPDAEAEVEVVVPFRSLDPELGAPTYAHPGDAGADLRAAESVDLAPGARALVGTGVAIALPRGWAGFVHPRSGLAARHGISIVNAPGTVDADYRGEIKVCLINSDPHTPVSIRRGDRIAQLVVQPVARARFVPVAALPDTVRGTDGHGSTGGMPGSEATRTPDPVPPTKVPPTNVPPHSQEQSA